MPRSCSVNIDNSSNALRNNHLILIYKMRWHEHERVEHRGWIVTLRSV